MAIGNLGNKVAKSDVDAVKKKKNPPEYEEGFEPEKSDEDNLSFDDIFKDLDMSSIDEGLFGEPEPTGFEVNSSNNSNTTGNNIFGKLNIDNSVFQPEKREYKPGYVDKAIDITIEEAKNFGYVLVELAKSLKNRSLDDIGYLGSCLIKTGIVMIPIGIVIGIIGKAANFVALGFSGLGGDAIASGALLCGLGLLGIGITAGIKTYMADRGIDSASHVSDVSQNDSDTELDEYEDSMDDLMEDLFGDLEESEGFSLDTTDFLQDNKKNIGETYKSNFDSVTTEQTEVDYDVLLNTVGENRYIDRNVLFNTFKHFFQCKTPEFATKKEIKENSEEFSQLDTICQKAMANVAKVDIDELDTQLESAYETYFSYELRLKRVKGVTKLDEIAREIEAYFRENPADTSVAATVNIEGDFYKINVTKGITAIVTYGDAIRQQYVCEYFLNTDHLLPFIVGISELGEVILGDAQYYDTMMIAGKPRSGKSWYLLSIMLPLMLFNTPEEVQFIVIDPKESALLSCLGLMPHVCGVHNDENILDIMREIIEVEGKKRKNIMTSNRCDDIWELWKKGIKLPVLYLAIDEIITVKNNLTGGLDKEFDSLMQTIISQLPSLGIRLIFVPHRATGIVNRTNRTMLQFCAAVKSNIEDVKDTLDIKSWKRQLVNQGDIAVKMSDREDALFVRGAAISPSNSINRDFIKSAAKAFYKMGVDMPDMKHLVYSYNRDEDRIREELSGGNRVQYNASNVLNDID